MCSPERTTEAINEDLYLIVVPELLENYKDIIEIACLEEESGIHFCKPLTFTLFFNESKEKLEHVFKTVFKKEKVFNRLLLEICETEIKHEFLERSDFLV